METGGLISELEIISPNCLKQRVMMLLLTKFFNAVVDQLLLLLFIGEGFCLDVASLQGRGNNNH